MSINLQSCCKKKKLVFFSAFISIIALAVIISVSSKGQTWADRTNMTPLRFDEPAFCQQVSSSIGDSLGTGMVDGGDCTNNYLYISTDHIDNITTLNITSPEGVEFENGSINIDGDWLTAFHNLTSLSITNMGLQDITPLGRLAGRLTYLDLSNNNISDLSPLERLSSRLTYLDLSNNNIGDLSPLEEQKVSLEYLNLSNNNGVGSGLRTLSKFENLETLILVNAGLYNFDDLFRPPDMEYNEQTGEPMWDENVVTSSKLAEALHNLDIRNNELSYEKEITERECVGNLYTFKEHSDKIAITNLNASNTSLNSEDLRCIAYLTNLDVLNVSNNHIDDFESLQYKELTSLDARSQSFRRTTESLEYSPIPKIFAQVGVENYFAGLTGGSNTAVGTDSLELNNATINGTTIRFNNAPIASEYDENPRPATITIPSGTGVLENSKIEVYYTGQVITFNDSDVCNSVYRQGRTGSAFYDINGNTYWDRTPVVLMNECNAEKKQIALVNGGSYMYLNLDLNSVKGDGSVDPVDLTGLEEFSSLQVLKLENNNLTNITPLLNSYQVQKLYLDNNNLENDDWPIITERIYNLKYLSMNNNKFSEIPETISYLYNLSNLYLAKNNITDVSPLSNATRITVLDLSENPHLTDFSGMVQEYSKCNPLLLKIENAGITSIPSADIMRNGFTNLLSLNLNGNSITNETIANLTGSPVLEELYLNNNKITRMSDFNGIAKLKKLFLDDNQITDVSGISSLERLAELHLKNNMISDITGLNTLPQLATLDIKNQTLTGATENAEEPYELPAVFSQSRTMEFSRIQEFQSTEALIENNGTVDYDHMTATMTDITEDMVIKIPDDDGSLGGTTLTVTYEGATGTEFAGTITNNIKNELTTITETSANSFTITSEIACMVLWSNDSGTTWNRLDSQTVEGDNNTRIYTLDNANGIQVTIRYAGDVNGDTLINTRDAREIIRYKQGLTTLTLIEQKLANVDGNSEVNTRDAREIINFVTGRSTIPW